MINSLFKFLKNNILLVILVPIVIISQIIILRPHLNYGFSDVDWGFLSIYKSQNPYSLFQFVENFKTGGTRGGVYTHQIYYIGIQSEFFGLDFKSFQTTTHIFKILAIIASFPLLLAVSGSSAAAFIATILFAFSYSAIGTMYTVVTSSDYSAIFSMGIFITLYWYVVKKNSGSWWLLLPLLLLLILTLFLSTERMYQLPAFIALSEAFLFWQRKKLDMNTKKRILTIFLPLLLIFLIKPIIFLDFLKHGIELIQGVFLGEWNLLLTPFIVLGSIILPHDYAKYLGIADIENFGVFLDFILSGPFPVLTALTILFGICIFKRPHVKIIQILALTFFSWVLLYVAGSHSVNHKISSESVSQALIGSYILVFAFMCLFEWSRTKNRLLVGLFVGPFFAFIYILFTWAGASVVEVFSGAHRYLTVPSILISLFLGVMLVFIYKRLKYFSFVLIIFFLILFIKINTGEITGFFNSQLYNGFGAADKQLMRDQIIKLTPNLSPESASLFYFDFTQDQDRGYYYDNTITGGFGTWMLWHPRINFSRSVEIRDFWNDMEKLKTIYQIKNGKKVFYLDGITFNVEDFYAFRFKDKKVFDIKNEILNELISP